MTCQFSIVSFKLGSTNAWTHFPKRGDSYSPLRLARSLNDLNDNNGYHGYSFGIFFLADKKRSPLYLSQAGNLDQVRYSHSWRRHFRGACRLSVSAGGG